MLVPVAGLLLTAAVSCDFARPSGDISATHWSLRVTPADGSLDAPRTGRIIVQVDRLLLPRTVRQQSVTLRSGAVDPRTVVRFMPVRRELWVDLDPRTPLDPETRYLLRLDGLADLDGNTPSEPFLSTFQTGSELGPAATDPQSSPAAALALLQSSCARASCHAASTPAAGLDLSSYSGISRTALGRSSTASSGTVGAESARGSLTLAALPIIDIVAGRGQPATSLLIYKVLGDTHVAGEPMPPDAELLVPAQLQLLTDWILSGAEAP